MTWKWRIVRFIAVGGIIISTRRFWGYPLDSILYWVGVGIFLVSMITYGEAYHRDPP